jgi:methionyl aminopeptidase
MFTRIKTAKEIERIKTSGQMLASVLKFLEGQLKPGITTRFLAQLASKELESLGGQPAFLGYMGFPEVICISLNDEVVHGIPGDREIHDGDLISLDFGVNYEGMMTDSAITRVVGKTSLEKDRLLKGTEEALQAGIKQVKDGVLVGDISAAVEKTMTKYGFGIVRDLVGHGVGHEVHEEPNIPNYGEAHQGSKLKAGMTIAIEPMSTLGGDGVKVMPDGWTFATQDGSLSAHFEHTVLITPTGAEIITEI